MMPGSRHFRGQQLVEGAAALERAADLQRFELERERRTRRPANRRQARCTGVRRTCGRMRPQAASTSARAIMEAQARRQDATWRRIVVEVRRFRARILGAFVVAAQPHGFGMQRIGAERLDLIRRHQAALQFQAAHRVGRELAEIVRLDGAEIALGRDVQADGLAHFRTETFGQPPGAQLLVHVVEAARGGVLAQLVDHVADIMQQRGKHGGGRRAVGLGQRRGLQRVLQLVDRAQAIALGGAADEDVEKFLTQGIAHAPFLS